MSYELAIIGAGNMAEAIARGVLRAKLLSPERMIATDVAANRRDLFSRELGIRAVATIAEAADAKIILLSVKPQHMATVLADLAKSIRPDALVISIAAGISSRYIETALGEEKRSRVIRTMPNTPMLVGEGMVAGAPGRFATAGDLATARWIFESAAAFIEVTEDKIDAVTAVSGSGPAYFFYLAERMIQAGVELGLTPAEAHKLATTTAAGAAKMLATSADSPQELRRKVTSPGGTTQAAIETMDSRGVGEGIVAAVKRAAARSRELGK